MVAVQAAADAKEVVLAGITCGVDALPNRMPTAGGNHGLHSRPLERKAVMRCMTGDTRSLTIRVPTLPEII